MKKECLFKLGLFQGPYYGLLLFFLRYYSPYVTLFCYGVPKKVAGYEMICQGDLNKIEFHCIYQNPFLKEAAIQMCSVKRCS